jgi:hypothetical protein
MLRPTTHKIAIYVAFVLLSVWLVMMSLLTPQTVRAYRPSYTTTEEESEKLLIDWRIANYNLVLDFFTGILAFSTIGLWIATQLTLRHNRETAERQLRAYVSVEPKGIRKLYPNKDAVLAHVGFHNTGSIFAKNVRIFMDTKLSENGDETGFPIDESSISGKVVIAPRATIFSGAYKSFPIIEIDTRMAASTSGTVYLYVWGIVQYHDGFVGGRFTKFCHRYNFRGRPQGKYTFRAKQGRYHQYGNEIDNKD